MSGPVRPTGQPTIGEAPPSGLADVLKGCGLHLDLGAASVRVCSTSKELAVQIHSVYRHHPLQVATDWADLHIEIDRVGGWRRFWRPQVALRCDLEMPFEPFPANHALPLLEWGSNWHIGKRLTNLLLLHAGVVERDGLALILPAVPGSGKSTLTAALSLRGWRLLSDEFGAFCPQRRAFLPMLKPVALKNRSIDVIEAFEPAAPVGPRFPNTRKGTVAHLAANPDAVRRRFDTALPGAVILPRWVPNAVTALHELAPQVLFTSLAFNAFNYKECAQAGFESAVHLSQRCPGWQLVYSELQDALDRLDALWRRVVERHRAAS